MRWGFLIFYCVILGIANWLVFTRAERRQFLQPTAAHDMPANWRIEDHDVRLEPSQRLYTKDPVRRGDVIAPAGLLASPNVVLPAGAVLAQASLDPRDLGLNAGHTVVLCNAKDKKLGPVRIEARVCATPSTCKVMIAVSMADAALVAPAQGKSAPVAQSSKRSCGA